MMMTRHDGHTMTVLQRTTGVLRVVAALMMVMMMMMIQPASGRCGDRPSIQTLVESSFGRDVIIRATLLTNQTRNSSCLVTVRNDTYPGYFDTMEGFGVLHVEEVFRGGNTTTAVGDEITFVYWTDTGFQQELPYFLVKDANSNEGILVFLSLPSLACADNTTVSEESIYSMSECDFGNGIPYEGGWANVSSDDQAFLRSLSRTVTTSGQGSVPAGHPTISTLTPSASPTSKARAERNSVLLVASFVWPAIWFWS
jgi:hypothetical protein